MTQTPKRGSQPVRRKHVPQRTCVACRQVQGKRVMARIVRTPDHRVVLDPTGKAAGRGAYVCETRSCWDIALKGRLEHALKCALTADDRQALTAHAESLPVDVNTAAETSVEERA